MVVPVLVFASLAGGNDADGWAIPMATDIAFAVGILSLFGSRLPSGARLFLLTLAIVDDIGAIVVIAIFYSGGVHATIVGAFAGLLVPARPVRGRRVLESLEHHLHPFSSLLVVPLFALANAGIDLRGESLGSRLGHTLTLAVVVGLVVGKFAGVFAMTWVAVRARIGRLPDGVDFGIVAGLAALAGIGFTVSIVVADLAFSGARLDSAKLGVVVASLASGILGATLLAMRVRSRRPTE